MTDTDIRRGLVAEAAAAAAHPPADTLTAEERAHLGIPEQESQS